MRKTWILKADSVGFCRESQNRQTSKDTLPQWQGQWINHQKNTPKCGTVCCFLRILTPQKIAIFGGPGFLLYRFKFHSRVQGFLGLVPFLFVLGKLSRHFHADFSFFVCFAFWGGSRTQATSHQIFVHGLLKVRWLLQRPNFPNKKSMKHEISLKKQRVQSLLVPILSSTTLFFLGIFCWWIIKSLF